MAGPPRGKLQAVSKTDTTHGGEGYCIVPHALFRHRLELNLDSNGVLVLVAIITRASGFDKTAVAVSTIVADTGLSASTVKRTLKKLKEAGLVIASEHRWIGPNKSATNTYDLTPLAERLRAIADARKSGAARAPPRSRSVAGTSPTGPESLFGTPNYNADPDETDCATEADAPVPARPDVPSTPAERPVTVSIDYAKQPVGAPLPERPSHLPPHVWATIITNIKVDRIKNARAQEGAA